MKSGAGAAFGLPRLQVFRTPSRRPSPAGRPRSRRRARPPRLSARREAPPHRRSKSGRRLRGRDDARRTDARSTGAFSPNSAEPLRHPQGHPHVRRPGSAASRGRGPRAHGPRPRRGQRRPHLHRRISGTGSSPSPALVESAPLQAVHPRPRQSLHRPRPRPLREKLGAGTIYKFGAAKPVLQALGRNEIVAILIDQNVLAQRGRLRRFLRPAGRRRRPAWPPSI